MRRKKILCLSAPSVRPSWGRFLPVISLLATARLACSALLNERPGITGIVNDLQVLSHGPDIASGWDGRRCMQGVEGVHVRAGHACPARPVPLRNQGLPS